jgi:hypothetical protein
MTQHKLYLIFGRVLDAGGRTIKDVVATTSDEESAMFHHQIARDKSDIKYCLVDKLPASVNWHDELLNGNLFDFNPQSHDTRIQTPLPPPLHAEL